MLAIQLYTMQEQGGTTSMLAYTMFPDQVEELQRLEEQINGGTTAGQSVYILLHRIPYLFE